MLGVWGEAGVFDCGVEVEGGCARAPRHDVHEGVLMLACRVRAGKFGYVYLTSRIEVSIPAGLEEGIDNCRVQHLATTSNGACDCMVQQVVKRFAAWGGVQLRRLVGARLRRCEEDTAESEGEAMSELRVRQDGVFLWTEASDPEAVTSATTAADAGAACTVVAQFM
jgi:hypothetical protein